MIVGYDFFSSVDSPFETRNVISGTKSLSLVDGMYDELHLSNNIDLTISGEKRAWATHTVMLAKFQNDLEAGSVGLNGLEMTEVRFKRRRVGELDWMTFKVLPYDVETAVYTIYDSTAQATEIYEYAIVPVAGELEGKYSISDPFAVEFDGCFILDKSSSYRLCYNFSLGNIEYINPNSTMEPIDGKYPIVVYNGSLNYRRGSLQCLLLSDAESDVIDLRTERLLREKIASWLINGKPKLYKDGNGTHMLISVVGTPTLSHITNQPGVFTVSFDFVEIGDPHNSEHLANCDMSEVGL